MMVMLFLIYTVVWMIDYVTQIVLSWAMKQPSTYV